MFLPYNFGLIELKQVQQKITEKCLDANEVTLMLTHQFHQFQTQSRPCHY